LALQIKNNFHRRSAQIRNGPIENAGSLQWDFAKLFREVETRHCQSGQTHWRQNESIGVDSWGVDFGLSMREGAVAENPYHYRDKRTDG
jgi:hypothetical protein